MGLVQSSTSRAAKFSGSGNHKRSLGNDRQPCVRSSRRYRSSSTSCNVSRNAKEFSRFWASGGQLGPKLRGNSTSSSMKLTRGRESSKKKSLSSSEGAHTRKSSQYSYSSGESNLIEATGGKLKNRETGRRALASRHSLQTSSCDNTYGVLYENRTKRNELKKIPSISLPHDGKVANVPNNLCYRFESLKL